MLALVLTADLNGITNLQPNDSEENPFHYTFRVQCTSCREIHPNWVTISRHETSDISGSRGDANFVWKCRNCKREHAATIKAPPVPYQHQSPPKQQKILEFDCRGLEFTEFQPEGEWLAKGAESGTVFTDIELVEGEWYDYDEKAGEEVSIKDIKWEIKRA